MNLVGSQVLTPDEAASQPFGTTNVLQTLDDLRAAIVANDVTGIQAGVQSLYQAGIQLENAQSTVASRMLRLDGAAKMNEGTRNTLLTVYGNVQTADYAKLAVEMTQQQTAFEATLSSTAKIGQMSLLDYFIALLSTDRKRTGPSIDRCRPRFTDKQKQIICSSPDFQSGYVRP